jgi:hypothetical protein
MKKSSVVILLVLLFAVLGYVREFFFVHMNIIMFEKYYDRESAIPVPESMWFFKRFSYNTLYYSKYLFTVLWTAIFFAANYFAVLKITGKRALLKTLMYAYVGMFVLAGVSMAYGYIFHSRLQADEYTISRWIMGIAQSPILGLILIAAARLYGAGEKEG